MKLRIYISGKVTGLERQACEAKFAAVEAELKALGVHTVINPLKLGIPTTWTYEQEMEMCLKVLREEADCIYFLSDWILSDGAKQEYEVGRLRGYRMFFREDIDLIKKLVEHSGKWIDTSHLEHP